MALDGLVISNMIHELSNTILNGRITKIHQPEADEINLVIKNNGSNYKLLLSASASLPLIYLTTESKTNPLTAPNFCMLLRKHIGSGKIIGVEQPEFERIIKLHIEHFNELGDLCTKYLIIEIMGKHSNIIFCDDQLKIIDSIKHISAQISSVREVLPGRQYIYPMNQGKLNPLTLTRADFIEHVLNKNLPLFKAIYSTITGISPLIAEELCLRATIDSSIPANSLNENESAHISATFERFTDQIKQNEYTPLIVYTDKMPIAFSSTTLSAYASQDIEYFQSISETLETFFASKNTIHRIRQRSIDLRKVITNALERSYKKYELQLKQIEDTIDRDKYKVFGELIHTYGYNITEGQKELIADNYYTNETIKIPLDAQLTPKENAQKYFDKYNKQKRTHEALTDFIQETKSEIIHLESITSALDIALQEEDLEQIKLELMEYGYLKKKHTNKKQRITSKPFHYVSSDGFHMFVGKNNYQNEELTFKVATGNDWWFHAKNMAGSHVIVKCDNQELPDRTFEEAAKLAAYYSKGRETPRVEIDYTEKKNIKKPAGTKPGFVIYHTNYSLNITPDIHGIERIN